MQSNPRVGSVDFGVEVGHGVWVQHVSFQLSEHGHRREEELPRRTHNPYRTPRRFDPQRTTLDQQRLEQLLIALLHRARMLRKPPRQNVLVSRPEVTEPERFPHLRAVMLPVHT